MINLLGGIVLGAMGSLLALFIVKAYTQMAKRRTERLVHRFWKFTNKRVVIIHPVYQDSGGSDLEEFFCRIEDEIAIQLFIELFKELKIDYSIQDHNKDIPNDSDVILMCSPKGNKQSKIFADIFKDKLPFIFTKDEKGLFYFLDDQTGTKYYSPLDYHDKKIDYGMIARITDHNATRNIYMFWGIHGAGTIAAAKFSLLSDKLKLIYQNYDYENFAVLIKASFESRREIGMPEQVTVPIRIETKS
ncbi:MAG: hypothetical protein GY940_02465 [bacterium]|nr:hypothetical protein [bacterium]